jgi:gamma-glutamyltranspeptidase / glutathione hydrolase
VLTLFHLLPYTMLKDFPYTSQRMPIMAKNIVATSQPLAAQAGLQLLLKGGNAVDAALATAICLTVVEPTSNGIGSDAFCILWDGQALHGLNASGRSPKALTPEKFAGRTEMPVDGWDTVTVPGCVSAWTLLSEKFGKLPFDMLFKSAIGYARDGFLVSPITAASWQAQAEGFKKFPEFAKGFMREGSISGGRAPKAGEVFRYEDQARTLELIAATKGEAFYRGELAEKMVADAKQHNALMTLEDLATHQADWVGTISQEYKGLAVHEIPPNGQGLAALIALGMLRHYDISQYAVDSAESLHLQLEAMKLALADVYHYVSDPATMNVKAEDLLEDSYLFERSKRIDMTRAQDFKHGTPKGGISKGKSTVYLTTADESGMMVSFIQSNYYGFGSGIVVPGTGISLQNRGYGFSLQQGHPNEVAGGKRPFHTIIPSFVTKQGQPLMSFGVMGGPMQAQGHVQMVLRVFDYGQNPQVASDAPRWRVLDGLTVALEPGFSNAVLDVLREKGHVLKLEPDFGGFGGAQLIYKTDGGYVAGSDHRKDGQAVGY